MISILMVFQAIIALALIGVILVQRSDGGALGGMGGGSFGGMLTGRSSANLLTRITAVLATVFMLNSLFLAILANYSGDNSIINEIEIEDSIKLESIDNTNKNGLPEVPSTE